jgi:hypothetical protein
LAIVGLVTIFGMRKSIAHDDNTVEPMQLKLSSMMTFFFSIEPVQRIRTGFNLSLGGHLKTGHTWSLQNRPTGLA